MALGISSRSGGATGVVLSKAFGLLDLIISFAGVHTKISSRYINTFSRNLDGITLSISLLMLHSPNGMNDTGLPGTANAVFSLESSDSFIYKDAS